jgi:hypothetical protein
MDSGKKYSILLNRLAVLSQHVSAISALGQIAALLPHPDKTVYTVFNGECSAFKDNAIRSMKMSQCCGFPSIVSIHGRIC